MASQRLLVTGGTGFLGRWTIQHWRQRHPEVEVWCASDRPCPDDLPAGCCRRLDLRDPTAVGELLTACRPTGVIHLAGLIGGGLGDLLSVNVAGTECLYRALVQTQPEAPIVQAGSAAIYGMVRPDELPVTERQPLRPLNAYALSKAAQDLLAEAMWRTHGLKVIRARIFNMLGPGQPDALVPMTFVRQLRACSGRAGQRLEVGNVSARRDFVDVRDVAAAFDALLEKGVAGEAYNVASGQDVSIRDVIDELLRISGRPVAVEPSADRMRASDVPCVRADVSKMHLQTGWERRLTLDQSLRDMWRQVEGPTAHGPGLP